MYNALTVICNISIVKKFCHTEKDEISYTNINFTNRTYHSAYMECISNERKYCNTKISNVNIKFADEN